MENILLYLSIGGAVGLVSGILGIGGGVLLLPALVWVCGMASKTASGTTLAVFVLPVLLPAALIYQQEKKVDLNAALFIALALGVGGFVGAYLRNKGYLPEDILRLCFGLIMMYVAFNWIVMSDSESAKAAAGAIATVAAWLAYLGLRIIGRRALAKPKLQEQILRMEEQGRGDPDYSI